MEYEKDLGIDPYALDEEWLRQPGLYMRYSEAVAEAQRVRDQAKEKIDVEKAVLDQAIRKDPGKYGLERLTETVVAGAILLQPSYKQAVDAYIDVNYRFNILQSAVRAFDHKRAALENEVKLWLGSYFSGPKAPRDIPGGKRIVDMARDNVSNRAREEVDRRLKESGNEKVEEPPTRRRRG